ncbi:membrane metallo-endopeptidase-like 1 isoform X2 [Penaeus indicus]|uniref:membrane metallo-endopeptidase-like 1 isoform X2 n=1 Tax=Penaeus indicus TaxID=29960 RepID=UPI00300CBADE
MAGATKRTTVCLTTVAIVFIVVIIILCVVPKPCRKGEACYDEGQAKSAAASGVITDTTTTQTSIASTETTSTTTSEVTKLVTISETTSSTTGSSTSTSVSTTSSSEAMPPVTEAAVTEASSTERAFETSDLVETTHGTGADENTTETVTSMETTEAVTTAETTAKTTEAETTITTTEEIPTTTEEYTFTYMQGKDCNTTACRRLAARMLDMMDNGDISPCADFYQYACGGVVDNGFLKPENPQYYVDRIIGEKLASVLPDDPDLGAAKVFFDGCLRTSNQGVLERLSDSMKVFSALESLLDATSGSDTFNLTETLTTMMKMHFTPLFDLTLDVDGEDPDNFVLRLSLPTFTSPFGENLAHTVCVGEYHSELGAAKKRGGFFDLDEQYDKYNECIKRGKGSNARYMKMKEMVKNMDLIGNHTEVNMTQRLNQVIIDLDFFLQPIVKEFPKKSIFRLHNLEKKYDTMSLADLMDLEGFSENINWQKLVSDLLGISADPKDIKVQVYFKDELQKIIEHVNENIYDASNIHAMFMMLWSEQLYNDFVDPLGVAMGSPAYCLRIVKNLMHDFSSYLYLEALGPSLDEYQQQINTMVRLTKRTAEEQLKRAHPSSPNNLLIEKLRKMTGETMDLQTAKDILGNIMTEVNITGNFIEDCRLLLLRYRSFLYSMYERGPSNPEVMWNQFLLPYKSYGTYVYAMNKFLIPYGAMAPPLFYGDDVPHYINFAGIGHMIAHELMHSFDGTGIYYDGERRNPDKISESQAYVPHTECLSEKLIYPQYVNTTSDLDTNFTLPHRLALNELLSDSAATRLAWETYISLRGRGGGSQPSRRRRSLNWYPPGARAKRKALFSPPRPTKPLPSTNTSEPKLPLPSTNTSEPKLPLPWTNISEPKLPLPWTNISEPKLPLLSTNTSEPKLPLPSNNTSEPKLPFLNLTPIQLYFLRTAQTQCSATSDIMFGVKEDEQLPSRLRVNMILMNDPLFAEAFQCQGGEPMVADPQCDFSLG